MSSTQFEKSISVLLFVSEYQTTSKSLLGVIAEIIILKIQNVGGVADNC